MKKGDIVLIPFPFTDLTGAKLRPAVILIPLKNDVTASFISTQINNKELTDIFIPGTSLNGLKKDSLLKVSKITTITNNLITGKLGELSDQEMSLLDQSLKILLKIK